MEGRGELGSSHAHNEGNRCAFVRVINRCAFGGCGQRVLILAGQFPKLHMRDSNERSSSHNNYSMCPLGETTEYEYGGLVVRAPLVERGLHEPLA